MTIIITGSAGFIGQALCKSLSLDEPIIGVDFHNADYCLDLSEGRKEFQDIVEFHNPRLIIHLAAYSHVIGETESKDIFGRNVMMTFNVVNAIKKTKPCGLILASSASVYGDILEGVYLPTVRDPCSPNEDYAISKYVSEMFPLTYLDSFIILRLANVYGPGQKNKFIPTVIDKAILGEKLILNGYGKQTRQFVYIDDVVKAFHSASVYLNTSFSPGDIFNIGRPEEISIREVAVMINAEVQDFFLKRGLEVPVMELVLHEGDQGSMRVGMDVTNFLTVCETPLEEGIKATVKAYMENRS